MAADTGALERQVELCETASVAMETLSRREESDLLERGKKEAMKHCEDIVKGEFVGRSSYSCRVTDAPYRDRFRRLCFRKDLLRYFCLQRQIERHEIVHEGLVSLAKQPPVDIRSPNQRFILTRSLSLERIDGMKRDYILNREQHREEAIREARNPTRKH